MISKLLSNLDRYKPPTENCCFGRSTSADAGIQYWYQAIKTINLQKSLLSSGNIAIVGYQCEEGIRRNLGRIGAKEGADAARKQLAKLAYHHSRKNILDVGNVVCDDTNLESTQQNLSDIISQLVSHNIFSIVIGGGHDVAYGHFKGLQQGLNLKENSKIGIINFDAHFDLRPVGKAGNSGTPFSQILEEHGDRVKYLALGIQQQSNTKELFNNADRLGVKHLFNYDCEVSNIKAIFSTIDTFQAEVDHLYVTIDMDGFSSAYAPGVSAPSPMGFTPFFVFKTLEYLFKTKKVVGLDIAELSPKYDLDNATARLAARLLDFAVGKV
ncbi:MAG: formiminoglutamase [Arcticibacterium sp.]|jgi:formiminoglutamase